MQTSEQNSNPTRELAEKIAAIEGQYMSPKMRTLFDAFDESNMSTSQRIDAVKKHFAAANGVR